MAAIFVILSNGWHPRWLTMAYVIETCAKYPLQQNWKKKIFRVSEVRFNLPRFNPRLKHLCVTFMHFKKVTKKISQNRLKISCVKSSENRLGNSSSHQLAKNKLDQLHWKTDKTWRLNRRLNIEKTFKLTMGNWNKALNPFEWSIVCLIRLFNPYLMQSKQNKLDVALFGSTRADTSHTFNYCFGLKRGITSLILMFLSFFQCNHLI